MEYRELLKLFFSGSTFPYGDKCERCRRYRLDTDVISELGTICNRCYLAMEELFLKGSVLIQEPEKTFPYLHCNAS